MQTSARKWVLLCEEGTIDIPINAICDTYFAFPVGLAKPVLCRENIVWYIILPAVLVDN